MNTNTANTSSSALRPGMSMGEAAKKGAIEAMDGRIIDSSGRPMTDSSGNTMRNDNGTLRPSKN